MMVHTTTAYITAERGSGGDFFFLKRNKTTATAMTKIKNSTPPTTAAVDDFLSAPCFGPLVFPEEKPTNKILCQHPRDQCHHLTICVRVLVHLTFLLAGRRQ